MIGADFEKIQFVLFGLDLVEPMAFITDFILGTLSIYFGYRIKKMDSEHPFFPYWRGFFTIFGWGALLGGFGHVLYNYWGVAGKFPSWISGPISVYFLEQAMISVVRSEKLLSRLKTISFIKLMLVLIAFTLVCSLTPIQEKPSNAFLPIAINTIIGVSLSAGGIGLMLSRQVSKKYKYFVLGVLVMLPSAFVFLMKINLHPWFDKNDLSHVLLGAGITYFFIGIRKITRAELNFD